MEVFFTLINIRTEDISRFKEKRLKSVTSGNLCKIRKIYVVTIIIRRFEQLSVTKYNENVVKNRFFLKKLHTKIKAISDITDITLIIIVFKNVITDPH